MALSTLEPSGPALSTGNPFLYMQTPPNCLLEGGLGGKKRLSEILRTGEGTEGRAGLLSHLLCLRVFWVTITVSSVSVPSIGYIWSLCSLPRPGLDLSFSLLSAKLPFGLSLAGN